MLHITQRSIDVALNLGDPNRGGQGESRWSTFLREHGRSALLDLPWEHRRTIGHRACAELARSPAAPAQV